MRIGEDVSEKIDYTPGVHCGAACARQVEVREVLHSDSTSRARHPLDSGQHCGLSARNQKRRASTAGNVGGTGEGHGCS
jgi:hypothetical protein